MIDMLLTPAKVINDNNVQKYELKKENSRTKKIKDMKLQEIADLYARGVRQREIAERLNLTQQTVSYRISLIKTNYQDLLQPEGTETALYQNTNNFTKIQTSLL
jgi:DNA-binding NarL/FixJ family response regulator